MRWKSRVFNRMHRSANRLSFFAFTVNTFPMTVSIYRKMQTYVIFAFNFRTDVQLTLFPWKMELSHNVLSNDFACTNLVKRSIHHGRLEVLVWLGNFLETETRSKFMRSFLDFAYRLLMQWHMWKFRNTIFTICWHFVQISSNAPLTILSMGWVSPSSPMLSLSFLFDSKLKKESFR